jgi:hypothetical protein
MAAEDTLLTVQLEWDDFRGGSPDDTPDPSEVTAIVWRFPANAQYSVDFTIDEIRFLE